MHQMTLGGAVIKAKALEKKELIKSPLNYIGGKFKLLHQILPLFPENTNQFVDLFAGGFNVGINVNAKKIYANDNLVFLVDMYKKMKAKKPKEIIFHIERRIDEYQLSLTNTDGYLSLRNRYNEQKEPLDLFVLIAYSFNHQIRFNNSHQFNNPFGANRSNFNAKMKNNLARFLNRMHEQNIVFSNNDFQEFSFDGFSAHDFVYCDPPYLITTGTYNDGKRGFTGWTGKEEKELLELLDSLNARGVKFGLSNVLEHKGRKNDILIEWAKSKPNYKINYLDFNYANSNYQTIVRDKAASKEVLITNYYAETV